MKINFDDIQQKLLSLMESYNLGMEEWATARAEHEKQEEMKKVTLNMLKGKYDVKSEAERERMAYTDPDYKKFMDNLFTVKVNFYLKQAQKDNIEQKIDVYRSLLAFERNFINLTK